MVTVNKISFGNLKELIEISYKEDNELFEKYHVSENMSFEDCVNAQMIMIKQAAVEVEVNYYKVVCDKKPIGYVVTFPTVLYSFAVNKAYRKPEILSELFEKIKDILGDVFICKLYANNKRAIGYLQKCGMEVKEENINSVTLVNN